MPLAQRVSKDFLTVYSPEWIEGIPFFLESDFNAWFQNNSNYVARVGSVYTVTGASVTDVLRGDGPYTQLNHSGDNIALGKTINNMGKKILIGSSSESEFIVFTRVQVPGLIINEGKGGAIGYVVTDNNCSDLTRPRFQVGVCAV
jgi:hypothetical protein